MKRMLCLWFPLWPIQRFRSARPEVSRRPLALYETTSRGQFIRMCSPRAAACGIRPGMPMAEAEALADHASGGHRRSAILWEPVAHEADRECLLALARLCRQRFSPLTAIEETDHPECLLLDIQGCDHLFGGEAGLAKDLIRCLRKQDWRLRSSVADTAGAAWAVAHYSGRVLSLVPHGQTASWLKDLPLAALRLPAEAIQTLEELGIGRIGPLLAVPRGDLAARFDPLVVRRLRQALGIEPELFVPVREPEPLVAFWTSEESVRDRADVETLVGQLLKELLEACRQNGLGLVRFLCRLEDTADRGEVYTVDLVRPSDDDRHLLNLLSLQWEQRPLPAAVRAIHLEAARTDRLLRRPGTLFATEFSSADRAAFSRLMERLSHRLGKESVLRAVVQPDAQPEFAIARRSWLEQEDEPLAPVASALSWERPLSLWTPQQAAVWSVVPDGPPQRVQWRRKMTSIHRWWGPERIETGWWRGDQVRRDYYRVELETGEWLWLFRTRPDGSWHLHGVFD